MNKCLQFFNKQVGQVEIMKDNKITKCYFQIPLVCNFMSDVIKKHIIKKADRSNDKNRIIFFNNNIERYRYLLELL